MRLGGFKLIERMEYPKFELYNLAADPAESRNLYWNMPAKVRELKGLLRDISELNRKLLAEQRVNAPPELEEETRQRTSVARVRPMRAMRGCRNNGDSCGRLGL